jgi:type IV secretory pathway VirD2 relaxase
MGTGGHAKAKAHARYLQRDGVAEGGRDPQAFTRDADELDLDDWIEASKDDPHQFRLIVSPEQSHDLDLDEYVRDYMDQVQKDVGQPLDWAAVTHHNTDQPHAHIILRGRDARGEDLYLDSDYLNKGLRHRAEEIATRHLGPRTREHVERSHARQREADHWTELDKHLLRAADDDGRVRADDISRPEDGVYVSTKNAQARLEYLADHDLADSDAAPAAAWKLAPDLRDRLDERRDKRDILRRMQRVDQDPTRWSLQQDPPVAGRVLDRGLSDEFADRHYLLVDGADGRAHHLEVDAGHSARVGDCVEVTRETSGVDIARREHPRRLVDEDGPTWLDRYLEDDTDHRGGDFGRAWTEAKRRRLDQLRRRGHLDDHGRPPEDLVKRLRADERRAFAADHARAHDLEPATLNDGDRVSGHLSEVRELRGGKVHVLETDDGKCVVVPSNRYMTDHADQRVRLTRKRGTDGRPRTYVDTLDRDHGRNPKQDQGPER